MEHNWRYHLEVKRFEILYLQVSIAVELRYREIEYELKAVFNAK